MVRKAKLKDAKEICSLISYWAKEGMVLERSLNYIYENIRDFWVFQDKEKLLGVSALHIVGWDDLAEIKSLVVDKRYHKRGIGKRLVDACLQEAKELEVKKVFVLTLTGSFFEKLGFRKIDKKELPHKIWSECVNCIYFPDCKEEAFVLSI